MGVDAESDCLCVVMHVGWASTFPRAGCFIYTWNRNQAHNYICIQTG